MGCDIHLITQIRVDNQWKYIEDVPKTLTMRSYAMFSVLADGVRSSFGIKGFEPKGLPDDLSERRFGFVRTTDRVKWNYENDSEERVIMPDGENCSRYDLRFLKKVETREEAEKYGSVCHGSYGYHTYAPEDFGGKIVRMPIKEFLTFEEYAKKYSDEWVEEMQEYGYWLIDFDSPDYHTPSWLTLKELLDYNKAEYLSTKVKIPKVFYDKFIKLGGVMPEGITITTDYEPSSIMEAVQAAFCPDVIATFQPCETERLTPLEQGIAELSEIAKKYEVSPYDIRIVFSFDN